MPMPMHQPGREQAERPGRHDSRPARREHAAAGHQHRPAAAAIDGPAGPGAEQGRDDQRGREGGEDQGTATPRSRAIGAASTAGR